MYSKIKCIDVYHTITYIVYTLAGVHPCQSVQTTSVCFFIFFNISKMGRYFIVFCSTSSDPLLAWPFLLNCPITEYHRMAKGLIKGFDLQSTDLPIYTDESHFDKGTLSHPNISPPPPPANSRPKLRPQVYKSDFINGLIFNKFNKRVGLQTCQFL